MFSPTEFPAKAYVINADLTVKRVEIKELHPNPQTHWSVFTGEGFAPSYAHELYETLSDALAGCHKKISQMLAQQYRAEQKLRRARANVKAIETVCQSGVVKS